MPCGCTYHVPLYVPWHPSPPQVIIRSSAKAAGHTWLREHLRSNYTAAWHEVRVRARGRGRARVKVRVRGRGRG